MKPFVKAVTIANGTSLSPAIDVTVEGGILQGILMSSAWTAATLTFQVSPDNVTFGEFVDMANSPVSFTVAAGTFIGVPAGNPGIWQGIRYFKIRSGTSGAPVNQAADRILTCVFRSLEG